jgi:hypothetical protein
MKKPAFERFLESFVVDPAGCWLWSARRDKNGYGAFWTGETTVTASSYMLSALLGRPLREGYVACHTCDNPPCVRPSHLFEGTYQDNRIDAQLKGRVPIAAAIPISRPSSVLGGSANGRAKLTPEQVAAIRSDPRRAPAIAVDYGVNERHIRKIKNGETWRKGEAKIVLQPWKKMRRKSQPSRSVT